VSDAAFVFALDHVVLTVRDIDATCDWYERVLGMRRVVSEHGRVALHFGSQKINLHPAAAPYSPHAAVAEPGTADLCFLSPRPIEEVVEDLQEKAVAIELGPVQQIGAQGPMDSVYFRDPDGNLTEVASYARHV
jgi:catechol 2,3-dioxygenase-like lactoylglutathione lyase family enzyme